MNVRLRPGSRRFGPPQQQAAEHDRVGGDDPLHVGRGDTEVLLRARNGQIHDRGVSTIINWAKAMIPRARKRLGSGGEPSGPRAVDVEPLPGSAAAAPSRARPLGRQGCSPSHVVLSPHGPRMRLSRPIRGLPISPQPCTISGHPPADVGGITPAFVGQA